jgi:hypothetical protein
VLKSKLVHCITHISAIREFYIANFNVIYFQRRSAFNFTVPFLSHLAIIALIIVSILLYAIPLRYLIMAFGVHKFTKKLFSTGICLKKSRMVSFQTRTEA